MILRNLPFIIMLLYYSLEYNTNLNTFRVVIEVLTKLRKFVHHEDKPDQKKARLKTNPVKDETFEDSEVSGIPAQEEPHSRQTL